MSPLLEVRDLHVSYHSRAGGQCSAIAGVSFDIRPGEILGVLGESGSGKSTLAAAMMRLLPANGKIQKGAVRFDGQDLLQTSPRELQKIRGGRIGLIFQEPSLALHPMIRIGQQISDVIAAHEPLDRRALREKTLQVLAKVFFEDAEHTAGAEQTTEAERIAGAEGSAEAKRAAEAERTAGAECRAQVERAAATERTTGVEHAVGANRTAEAKRIAESYPHQLSGGQRQRVLLAQAIACNPALLIADEPTASLDPSTQQEILALFQSLRQQLDCAMILITHNPALLAGLADRVLVLYAGKVAEIGPTKEILASPQHPYTRALLRCLPPPLAEEFFPRKNKLMVIPGDSPNLAHLAPGCRFEPRCADRMDVCTASEPAELATGKGHTVSCFRYGG